MRKDFGGFGAPGVGGTPIGGALVVKTTDDLKTLVAAANAGDAFILASGDHAIDTTGGGVTISVDNVSIAGSVGARLVGGDQGGAVLTIANGVDRARLEGFRILVGTSDTHGIHISGASTQGIISKLHLEKAGTATAGNGIQIDGTDVTVSEFIVEDIHFEGANFTHCFNAEMTETTTASLDGMRVNGCIFDSPLSAGFRLASVSGAVLYTNITISGCRFESGQDGINIAEELIQCTIDNCIFANHSRSGVHSIDSGWRDCVVSDSVFRSCAVQGIITGGGDFSSITGNSFRLCPTAINVQATFNSGVIANNSSFSGTAIGYVIAGGTNSIFIGNVASSHTTGLSITSGANSWIITNNSFSSGTNDGIDLIDADKCIISGNRCSGNASGTGIIERVSCDGNLFGINYLEGNATDLTLLGTNRGEIIFGSSVIASDGFATKLFKVSTSVFEIAVAGTEYNSPNQHGGIFGGTIFRRYYAIPDAQGTGDTIEIAMGFTLTGRIVEVSGISLNEDGNQWQPMPYVDFGGSTRNLELSVNSSTSKIRLIGGSAQDWTAGGFILLDYTK